MGGALKLGIDSARTLSLLADGRRGQPSQAHADAGRLSVLSESRRYRPQLLTALLLGFAASSALRIGSFVGTRDGRAGNER